MSEKRRQYTEEFKQDVVRLVTEHGYGATEAARNRGDQCQDARALEAPSRVSNQREQ
jgi:hypothetical protein